jgi:DnaJ-class molecular chaperone
MEMVTIVCYVCKGTGKIVFVDIEDGYGEEQICRSCEGKGELKEPHSRYF